MLNGVNTVIAIPTCHAQEMAVQTDSPRIEVTLSPTSRSKCLYFYIL